MYIIPGMYCAHVSVICIHMAYWTITNGQPAFSIYDIVERNFVLMFSLYYCFYTLPNCYLYYSSYMVWLWNSFFSCDQAALRTLLSVCPSVRPSVRPSVTPFSQCSCHRIIMKFSGLITNDKSDDHVKGLGQRSKVKVTEVKTPFSHFRTVTPVWIGIWWVNDAQSLMLLSRGALLSFKVICQISRSHG